MMMSILDEILRRWTGGRRSSWRRLGIDKLNGIGSSDRQHGVEWRAFFQDEGGGGSNSPGQRLNLDSGIFNDDLMQPGRPASGQALAASIG